MFRCRAISILRRQSPELTVRSISVAGQWTFDPDSILLSCPLQIQQAQYACYPRGELIIFDSGNAPVISRISLITCTSLGWRYRSAGYPVRDLSYIRCERQTRYRPNGIENQSGEVCIL